MDNHQVIEALRDPTRELRHAAPEVWKAFAAFREFAAADGIHSAAVGG